MLQLVDDHSVHHIWTTAHAKSQSRMFGTNVHMYNGHRTTPSCSSSKRRSNKGGTLVYIFAKCNTNSVRQRAAQAATWTSTATSTTTSTSITNSFFDYEFNLNLLSKELDQRVRRMRMRMVTGRSGTAQNCECGVQWPSCRLKALRC